MKLTWRRLSVHTKYPFRIARPGSSVDGNDVHRIIVEIERDGIVGRGEAAPSSFYGQSLETVEATLAQAGPLLGDDPFQIGPIVDRLLYRFNDHRAAVAAIDEALHDWVGQKLEVPVWRLLGLDAAAVPPTSMTVGIDNLDLIAQKTREASAFEIIKVKVGTADDEAILSTVREHAPHQVLRVDANCGWSADQARDRIEAIRRFNLELIEQPIASGQYDALQRLTEAVDVPVITDEDSATPDDVLKLAGRVDGVNVKLSKCGGIRQGFDMIRLARAHGLKVMVGCMVETSIGVSAIAQLAPLADFADLDGHLLLADDPFTGPVLRGATVYPPDAPGLGIGSA
ncbi:MAG: dipeptide epimerase [Phycisphaerales bacterium]|nr:MAG: dipeptide epimerase [Phycisphaerales bacterium]